MSDTITRLSTLVTVDCYRCGVLVAVPEAMMRRLRDTGDTFWCPSGHAQQFATTTAARLEKEREARQREREQAAARLQALQDQADATERSNRALRGVNTRMKNRIAAGVCPCCQRSFPNVADHMSTVHPNFADGAGA